MAFDLKKSVQEYTNLTVFGTPKSDIREREGKSIGILNDVLTQSPEVQEAFNQAVCQQTDRVFHGWDYWLGGRNAKAVRQAILHNQPPDCSNAQKNRQLTVDLLNPEFAKISFGDRFISSPELEEFKELYLTGEFKLADDLTYILDALPDFRTDGAKARLLLTSLIPAKWLAYIGLFGGAFSFGFGTAKVNQAIQELNHIQDEKQRKEAIRDLARGSSTMLLSLVSMLGASRNFDWSAGKNVTRLPTVGNKIPEQPNRAILPEDKITPIRSEPSPTSLNQKPATDDLYPQVANDNAYPLGNSSGPNGSPPVRFKGEESFSNNPVQPLRSVAAGGSGRESMSGAASQKAEEICVGAKYSFNGNAALAVKPNPVQTIPIPASTAPGQCGNGAALPANSPLIFSDYNGEHVSHASIINLKGVEEYLAHLIASFPAVLAMMMSGDNGGVKSSAEASGKDSEDDLKIKELFKFHKFTPDGVKVEYVQFAYMVMRVNPTWTIEEVVQKIKEVESNYDHYFYGITYGLSFGRSLVRDRNRLSALAGLNLINPQQMEKLQKLTSLFKQTVNEIVKATGESPTKVQKDVDSILITTIAKDLEEAKRIIIHGPDIVGFEQAEDVAISNATISQFLSRTFGNDIARKVHVGRIEKSNQYHVYTGRKPEDIQRANDLLNAGILTRDNDSHLIALTKEDYFRAALVLEGVNKVEELQHLYKVRAEAGAIGAYHKIHLYSFGIEKSSDLDFLREVNLDSEEDKMRAYILGVIAHEISHRYEPSLSKQDFADYKKIVSEEAMPGRRKYVSDYVLKHEEIYKSAEGTLMSEDLAESVRIYTTNSNYLRQNYPRRYAFVQSLLPFIQADTVVRAVRESTDGGQCVAPLIPQSI